MTAHGDVITGPERRPRNLSAAAAGSIHDDATATALGFRGGTVAGSIHMDQFPPLLLEAFGPGWFESGSLALYFRHATIDGEPVVALLERPPAVERDAQVRAWATTTDGTLVADGTAAGNPAATSALRSRDLRPVDPAELRILAALRPGDAIGDCQVTVDGERQRSVVSQGFMTEPLDWYTGSSPWGGPIAAPSTVVNLLYADLLAGLRTTLGKHVGLFGAIEIRFLNGPVFLGRRYRVTGEVVALSQTPKTEVLWFDSQALDEAGRPVADMRMMLRQMKQSSPRYAETQPTLGR
jgi:acyl dehydratase